MRLSQVGLDKLLKNSHCAVNAKTFRATLKKSKAKKQTRSKRSKLEEIVHWEFIKNKKVKLIKIQPEFELAPPFTRHGKRYRGISYTADFLIEESGQNVVVEVKSKGVLMANKKNYPMRRKLFLRAFPELLFREIIFDDNGNRKIKEY